jgi:hypothetical protein
MASLRAGTRPPWLPALVVLLLVALQWAVFVPRANESTPDGEGLHSFDFHSHCLPRYVYGNQGLHARRLPVWSRLEFAGPPPASVRVASPTRLDVEIELPRPGILVATEPCNPGLRAWADGALTEILRALDLAAGAHRVRFDYRPWSVRTGAL